VFIENPNSELHAKGNLSKRDIIVISKLCILPVCDYMISGSSRKIGGMLQSRKRRVATVIQIQSWRTGKSSHQRLTFIHLGAASKRATIDGSIDDARQ